MRLKGFFFLFILTIPFFLSAQINVKGTVRDLETGKALIGVVIQEMSTLNGCVTNDDGEFNLEVTKGNLRIQYTGYELVDTNYVSESPILIYLKKDTGMHIFSCPIILYAPDNQLPGNYTELRKEFFIQHFNNPVSDVMNTMPGVFMQSGALNTNRLSSRGIGNRSPFSTSKIKIYLDDIPITNGIGESTIEDLDINIFDKIKLIKGPGASPYGANLGGLVHLISPEIIQNKSAASIKTSVESFGTFITSNQLSLQKRQSGLFLSQQYVHSDGFRDNNNYDKWNFAGMYKQRIKQSSLNIFVNHIDLDAQIPSSLNAVDFLNNPRKAADNWASVKGFENYKKTQFATSFIGDLKNNNLIKLALFTTLYDAYELRPFNILDDASSILGFRSSFQSEEFLNTNLNLLTGGEIIRENYNWRTYETIERTQGEILNDYEEQRSISSLFSQLTYKTGRSLLEMAINIQNITYSSLNKKTQLETSNDFGLSVNPKFGMSYLWQGNSRSYLSIAHGISQPNFEESLLPDGGINPDIKLEKAWSFELGQRGNIQDEKFYYDISLYRMYDRDMLVGQRGEEDQFYGINAGSVLLQGIEFLFKNKLNWPNQIFNETTFVYNFSHHRFIDFQHEGQDYSDHALPGSAPHRVNLITQFKRKKNHFTLEYNFTDSYPVNDANTIYNSSYQLLNISMGQKVRITGKMKGEITFGVRNLFDEKYASMVQINASSFGNNLPRYFYSGKSRNFFVTFKFDFVS